MPTYQYACTGADCGNRFELVQSFTDPAASECPVCGSPVRKVYSAVGVVFKGSGFYRTDSRNGSGKSSSLSANGKESSSSDASSGSAAKSAAKESAGSAATSSGSGGSSDKAAASA